MGRFREQKNKKQKKNKTNATSQLNIGSFKTAIK